MLLAQLTDTHVINPSGGTKTWLDNNGRLSQAVAALNAEAVQPRLVLATGDLTNNGESGEIDELVDLLEPLEVPLLALPGNHDSRPEIRRAFGMPWADAEHLSWIVDEGELRIIGLDTTLPGSERGVFDADREQWLGAALADQPERATVIAMHHPPFASGIGWMDQTRLSRSKAFADLITTNPQVGRIFCGHLHRPIFTTVAGVATSVGPSTTHHVELNLSPDAKVGIIRDPAGYQLHTYDGTAWTSHLRYIDTGESPITFDG